MMSFLTLKFPSTWAGSSVAECESHLRNIECVPYSAPQVSDYMIIIFSLWKSPFKWSEISDAECESHLRTVKWVPHSTIQISDNMTIILLTLTFSVHLIGNWSRRMWITIYNCHIYLTFNDPYFCARDHIFLISIICIHVIGNLTRGVWVTFDNWLMCLTFYDWAFASRDAFFLFENFHPRHCKHPSRNVSHSGQILNESHIHRLRFPITWS